MPSYALVPVRVVIHFSSFLENRELRLEVELFEVSASKFWSLFTRRPFWHTPLQFIQHPLCFRLSFMNQTVNRKTVRKTAGTMRRAPLTETLTREHTSQNKKVITTPAKA
jgi:hypothetical protein